MDECISWLYYFWDAMTVLSYSVLFIVLIIGYVLFCFCLILNYPEEMGIGKNIGNGWTYKFIE